MKKLNFELVGTLQDGTSVSLDEFAVGGTISIVAADGTKTTAPDGDYAFSDGSVATVTDGKISAITSTPADAEADSTQTAPSATETDADTSAGESPAEQATDTPADADAATEQAEEDEDEDGEVAAQILQIQQTIAQMATDIAALQAGQQLMKSDLATHKTITDEKFSAGAVPSAIKKPNVKEKQLTYAQTVAERIKSLNR